MHITHARAGAGAGNGHSLVDQLSLLQQQLVTQQSQQAAMLNQSVKEVSCASPEYDVSSVCRCAGAF